MMTNATDDVDWWALHLRHARGELLSTAEEARYRQHLDRLEADERLLDDLEVWRVQREEIRRLERECNDLQARRASLAKIVAQLDTLLGVGVRGATGS